jgi:hypothetical protein
LYDRKAFRQPWPMVEAEIASNMDDISSLVGFDLCCMGEHWVFTRV